MIIYHPEKTLDLMRYGILIPLKENRAKRAIEELFRRRGLKLDPHQPTEPTLSFQDLSLAHNADFVARLQDEKSAEREIQKAFELFDDKGNPHRYDPGQAKAPLTEMVEDIRAQSAMTVEAMRVAMGKGFSYHLGGGMHHAMTFGGRGFCLINDIVIGLRKLQREEVIERAWVIDVDAHKGDGTAEMTYGDPSIATFSLHMAKGWPLDSNERDENGEVFPWFYPSTVDVPIHSGEEDVYLGKLKAGIERLREESFTPDLIVINHGADPFEEDGLPSTQGLRVSEEDLLERDLFLERTFEAWGIPRVYLMSGGYGDESYRIYSNFFASLEESKLFA